MSNITSPLFKRLLKHNDILIKVLLTLNNCGIIKNMKYRKLMLASGGVLIVAGIGTSVALQPVPQPKPVHLAAATTKPATPQFQPQVTTSTNPTSAAVQTAPTAASEATATTPSVAPATTTVTPPTEPASCTATDLDILNNARSELAAWEAQGSDPNSLTTAVHAWTYEVTYETSQGCQ